MPQLWYLFINLTGTKMNKKIALIVIPVCLSIALLGVRLPHFKLRSHSRSQPIINALEESASDESKVSVDEIGHGNSRLDIATEKTLPLLEAERPYHSKFKLVNIVTRPPPAVIADILCPWYIFPGGTPASIC